MRVAPCMILLALCLSGCSLFGKKQSKAQNAADGGAPPPPAPAVAPRPPNDPLLPDSGGPPPGFNGIIAGQIIDNYNQRPAGTYIQVVEAQAPPGRAGAPIEVPADNQGYFTIKGLQPGKQYELIARSRSGNRYLAGVAWATPPDPKVLIRVSDNYPVPNAPPGQAAPRWPAPNGPTPGPAEPPPPNWGGQGGVSSSPGPGRSADLGTPIGVPNAPSTQYLPPPPPVRPENLVGDPTLVQHTDVPARAPGPGGSPAPQPAPQLIQGRARVPSCDLTGRQLNNFALYDLDGKPWEFRDHRARLTLVDFWGTWCIHCLHSIPNLRILQDRYGNYGLRVVGIAYESGPMPEQVVKVNRVRQRLQMNYQVLLGGDRDHCPVRQQFSVVNYPTLFLLDVDGKIIWRAEGLDQAKLRELEVIIQQRLGVR